MKNIGFGLFLTVIVVVGILLWQRPQTQPSQPMAQETLEDITQQMANGAVLVDVRTPEEYAQGHAVGAVNIPLQQLEQNDFGELDPNQQIFVYCRSGNRSAQAEQILNQAGYSNTVDLESLTRWQQLGGDVVTE